MRRQRSVCITCGLMLLSLLAACQPKGATAQFVYQQPASVIRRVPARGSVSKANSNAYEREVDLGALELSQGVSNSRVVTKSNGGVRNGGTTSVSKSNAISRDVNIGGLDIGGTLTRTQSRTNGATSRGVAYDFNVGNLGLGASLSPQNLKNGLGLHREPGGGVSLGLGFLDLDLTNQARQSQALTQAQVNAQGKNARAKSNSNANTQTQQYGGVGVTTTQSHSSAVGRTKVGQTSASTGGLANNVATNAAGGSRGFFRVRRTPAPAPRVVYQPAVRGVRQFRRPRRDLGALLAYNSNPFVNLREAQQRRYPAYPPYPSYPTYPARNTPVYVLQQNSSVLIQQQGADATELTDLRRPYYRPPMQPNNVRNGVAMPPPTAPTTSDTEQFGTIDETQPQARTFSFITDFINSLQPCVYPCTLEAFQQNRCCVVLPTPTTVCCNSPPMPVRPPRPPLLVPAYPPYQPQPFIPQRPFYLQPVNCCVRCINYGFYGPPPCTRYGVGGLYSVNGGTVTNTGTAIVTNTGQTIANAPNFATNILG